MNARYTASRTGRIIHETPSGTLLLQIGGGGTRARLFISIQRVHHGGNHFCKVQPAIHQGAEGTPGKAQDRVVVIKEGEVWS